MPFVRIALVAVLALWGTDLQAQRQGVWVSGGVGFGFARARCEVCINNRDGGLSGYARFGGTVSPSFLLGVEGNGWRHTQEDLDFELGAISAVGFWYPSPTGTPWFLKGGFGLVAYRIDDNDPDEDNITARSFGGQFGAGYDLQVGAFSFTPYLTFVGSLFANLESGNERLADVSLTLIQIGLGLTFH